MVYKENILLYLIKQEKIGSILCKQVEKISKENLANKLKEIETDNYLREYIRIIKPEREWVKKALLKPQNEVNLNVIYLLKKEFCTVKEDEIEEILEDDGLGYYFSDYLWGIPAITMTDNYNHLIILATELAKKLEENLIDLDKENYIKNKEEIKKKVTKSNAEYEIELEMIRKLLVKAIGEYEPFERNLKLLSKHLKANKKEQVLDEVLTRKKINNKDWEQTMSQLVTYNYRRYMSDNSLEAFIEIVIKYYGENNAINRYEMIQEYGKKVLNLYLEKLYKKETDNEKNVKKAAKIKLTEEQVRDVFDNKPDLILNNFGLILFNYYYLQLTSIIVLCEQELTGENNNICYFLTKKRSQVETAYELKIGPKKKSTNEIEIEASDKKSVEDEIERLAKVKTKKAIKLIAPIHWKHKYDSKFNYTGLTNQNSGERVTPLLGYTAGGEHKLFIRSDSMVFKVINNLMSTPLKLNEQGFNLYKKNHKKNEKKQDLKKQLREAYRLKKGAKVISELKRKLGNYILSSHLIREIHRTKKKFKDVKKRINHPAIESLKPKFYFPLGYDFRLRLTSKSNAHYLNNKDFRHLFTPFFRYKDDIDSELINETLNRREKDEEKAKKKNRADIGYNILSTCLNRNYKHINLDAPSSVLQIINCILENGYYENELGFVKEKNKTITSLYTRIAEQMLKEKTSKLVTTGLELELNQYKIAKPQYLIIHNSNTKTKNRTIYLSDKEHDMITVPAYPISEELAITLVLELFTDENSYKLFSLEEKNEIRTGIRDFAKGTIMPKCYGSGLARIHYQVMKKRNNNLHSEIIYLFCHFLVEYLTTTNLLQLHNILSLIHDKYLLSTKTYIPIPNVLGVKIRQAYREIKYLRVSRRLILPKQQIHDVRIKSVVLTDKLNTSKSSISFAANFIQSHDAVILHLIVLKLRKLINAEVDHVPLIYIHDSVTIAPILLALIRKIAREVHYDLFKSFNFENKPGWLNPRNSYLDNIIYWYANDLGGQLAKDLVSEYKVMKRSYKEQKDYKNLDWEKLKEEAELMRLA